MQSGVLRLVSTLFFVLCCIRNGHGGITSTYVRSEWPSTDIPYDHEVFAVPKGYNAPQQVHITQGDYDGRAVIISWVTPDEPGSNEVHYGTAKDNYQFTAKGKVTNYTFYHYKSGYIHHSLVDGLEYDTKYYYKVGNGDSCREFWFKTPPEIGPDVPYKFGIIGDLGQTYNSLSTLEHYMGSGGETVLFVGDLSYADKYKYNDVGLRWDTWGRFTERSTAYQPWLWCTGNHEVEYLTYMVGLGEVTDDFGKQTIATSSARRSNIDEAADTIEVVNDIIHPENEASLLLQFEDLFEPREGSPLRRACDHIIHLHVNSVVLNIRPYRYPHYQKAKIERLVSEMISADELLDELQGAAICTKLRNVFKFIANKHRRDVEFQDEVEPFKNYLQRYTTPYKASRSSSPLWYAIRRASTHIIVLNSYSPYVKSTPQYKWLAQELKMVDREKTPWLIVLMHVPIYNSNEAHYLEGESMRVVFEKWFVQYKVDVIFAGHVHAYERSYRISNIHDTMTSGCQQPMPDDSAPVYITVGDGGNQKGLAGSFIDPQPDYSAFREASYGHSTLEIINRTHALYHWIRNDDGKKVPTDAFVLYNQYWGKKEQGGERKKHSTRGLIDWVADMDMD